MNIAARLRDGSQNAVPKDGSGAATEEQGLQSFAPDDESRIQPDSRVRVGKLRDGFRQAFGHEGNRPLRFFFAPGRVNLIGEHTDYTGGLVLPAALSNGTWAAVSARNDRVIHLVSEGFAPRVACDLTQDIVNTPEDGWANYPKGIIKAFLAMGVVVPGLDICFYGDIPKGAGLSSSASLELVTAVALNILTGAGLDRLSLVRLAQEVENRFVGVNCGIMDQFAVGLGRKGAALLLNCATLAYRHIPLALGEYRLVITNSGKQRDLGESKYNERRRECEDGFRIIKRYRPELANLGELGHQEWKEVKKYLPAPTADRVEHVVRENHRVLASAAALEDGDVLTFGQLMLESHRSLRDLYEVTGPELDALYEVARKAPGCIGTRMTGAGFGGCTVGLVEEKRLADFQKQVAREYEARTGLRPIFYPVSVGDGAREISPAGGGDQSDPNPEDPREGSALFSGEGKRENKLRQTGTSGC
ncbi:galactokinase [Acididesulfobacillus acetoxydans]|uniref:Galactokinase n=1 Tax=Acididesulfobacillus acetoxydans TaxID=1561005 RepID=A0A8S0W381_9FIRM|nr:galactokinase [Acididesulfobacillus acetoxydans]CAA7601398.1 galactokinase [Acididesulfobacillus acetoxydans]CEJ08829.1 Galactokinase [Acididesulfobacillus acetoxydans]